MQITSAFRGRTSNFLGEDLPRLNVENPHAYETNELVARLRSDLNKGLVRKEAEYRLQRIGPNLLAMREGRSVVSVLFAQLTSPVVWLLIFAMLLAAFLRDIPDVIAIGLVIVLNSSIGFISEWRAERAMSSLRALGVEHSTVIRNGSRLRVSSDQLVPGDIVIVEAGDLVQADIRIGLSIELATDESALTGESMPKEKTAMAVQADALLADRNCMLFKGTAVTRGTATGLVVATGMRTELGRIASLISSARPQRTPLEEQLGRLGWQLSALTLIIASLIAVVGLAGGRDLGLIVQTAIALAVAAIPEGLPIVATLALARGMWRMVERNALLERLAAVETLGEATLICTDKTGTLTENRMTVVELWTEDGRCELDEKSITETRTVKEALEAATLCNNAVFDTDQNPLGDPMEVALLIAAQRIRIDPSALKARNPRKSEIPFNSTRKMMATTHTIQGDRNGNGCIVYVKGAPEAVVAACDLSIEDRALWKNRTIEMASEGLRVIAVASRVTTQSQDEIFKGLKFLGLIGFEDPPRADIRDAMAACRSAGVRVVMMTGDHAATARNIALDVGLVSESARVVDGAELGELAELSEAKREEVRKADIFARVSPSQKFDLVRLHQDAGEIVAVTGDGVNDAPALKQADIGVAMGIRGTPVAREAATMVLRDDAFSTIVAAIREGRVIFRNIQRFTVYLLSCNLSEILLIAAALALGLPLPLTPLQILFLNLVTDVFPAFALGLGSGDKAVLQHRPRTPDKPILTSPLWTEIVGLGMTIAVVTLSVFWFALHVLGRTYNEAITVSFLTLALAQIWNVFNMRDPRSLVFQNDIVRNRYVWGALALCVVLLAAALLVPSLRFVLDLVLPDATILGLAGAASLIPLLIGQMGKEISRTAYLRSRATSR